MGQVRKGDNMDSAISRKFQSLSFLIGNTPLLCITFRFRGSLRRIYAKAEYLNLTGSIKDRMALHILKRAYEQQRLKPGDMIVEATSGNTGISFAAIGRALGHPVTIFMPDWMSRERVDLIQSTGAQVRPVTREEGGFLGSIKMAEELSTQNGAVFSLANFQTWITSKRMRRPPRRSSGGSFSTTESRSTPLSRVSAPAGRLWASPNSSAKCTRASEFIHWNRQVRPRYAPAGKSVIIASRASPMSSFPQSWSCDALDDIIDVHDGDAILMSQRLARELGLSVGISSGANLLAAIKVQEEMSPSAVVATVFADDSKKYLSTDLFREEPVKPDYLTPDIELVGFSAIKRVCHTCCDFRNCTEKPSRLEESPS